MSELSRLRWRCRRGIKEMDLVFQRFLEQEYAELSEQEKELFEQILDESDLDILDWILERQDVANTHYEGLVKKFRQFKSS